jgi:alanine dehydrogenase
MFKDADYQRAGAQIAYTPAEAIGRAELVTKISRPSPEVLDYCKPRTAFMAFYHMAVADRAFIDRLVERSITAVCCEVIEHKDGSLPVLAAISEIAGQMTVPIAAHLMRTSSGGRGILLGGTPGVPPARVVVIGVGSAGFAAVRGATGAGARVTAFDSDPRRLRHVMEHVPSVETCLSDEDAIAEAVIAADVVIGSVLVPGKRTPNVVTRAMVERMKHGTAMIDVSIDQGGCFETSHPTFLDEPTFVYEGVTHFCVPNFTADLGRSASIAIAQALLPYVLTIAKHGVSNALERCAGLSVAAFTLNGRRP